MKRGPKIKLRTRDGKTVEENSTYYVVSKEDSLPRVQSVKTKEYPVTSGMVRHPHIWIRRTEIGGCTTVTLDRGEQPYCVFADKNKAKRYQKYLIQAKVREIQARANNQLASLRAL